MTHSPYGRWLIDDEDILDDPLERDSYAERSEAWHYIAIRRDGKGGAWVYEETNDNYDLGYASGHANWEHHWSDADKAIAHYGRSRFGMGGVKVEVYIDGEKV
jgi:hypothetical protein